MPLQVLPKPAICSQQPQGSLKISSCYWRWSQKLPLQKNQLLRKERLFNKR